MGFLFVLFVLFFVFLSFVFVFLCCLFVRFFPGKGLKSNVNKILK